MNDAKLTTIVQPQAMNSSAASKEPPAPAGPTPAELALHPLIQQAKRAGKPQDAVAAIEAALLDDPANGRLHWRLGEVYREARQFREAKDVFERAVAAFPSLPDLRAGLGVVCQELKLSDEAVTHFEQLVKLRPDNGPDWNNLGIAHSEKRAFERAIECYEKAIELDPKYAFAWNNLGNALGYGGRHADSMAAFDRAIELKPDYAEAYNNRAVTRTQLEDHEAALADYSRALHFRADYSEAHTNRSLLMLLLGQFQQGWTEYEWRWKGKENKGSNYAGQRWDGGPIAGKRMLIYAEQGLGDTLQFIRYARELKARGATVYLECQRPLCKLLSRTPGVDKLFHRGQQLPPYDYHVPMLSVPGLMETATEAMPSASPYVVPDPGTTERWAERLTRYGSTFNVGIVWQGNPNHRGDRKRSIPLKQFAPLAAVAGVRLFTLQKGFGVEQIAAAAEEVPLTDLGNVGITEDGFLRTAGIIKNLDLIVAADTSVAHLAGALGVPVWIAMSTACDWRWLVSREDTPWYPTMRLFRQKQPGEWPEVFARIVEAVKPLAEARLARPVPSAEARKRARSLVEQAGKHLSAKEPAKAQPILEEAVKADPDYAVAHHDLGIAHLRQQHYADAERCFRETLKLEPAHANAAANLGAALMNLRQYAEAGERLKDAVRLGVASPAVHNNLGAALAHLGDHPGAEAEYHRALRIRPDYPGAHFNLSHALFAQGRLEEAWVEHEWRWKMPGAPKRRFNKPRWAGEQLDGKTVFLYAEQSVEDTILFARFAKVAKDHGGRVVVECPAAAVGILKSCPFVDEVVPAGSELPAFDIHLPLMSVPGLNRCGVEQLPVPIPYSFADEAAVAAARGRVEAWDAYRIGIARQASGEYPGDRRHDLPASLVAALAALPDVQLFDLQRSPAGDNGGLIDDLIPLACNDGSAAVGDELAYAMAATGSLDLIVTADNAIAHIAGATGSNTWTFLAPICHWRWLGRVGDNSPWYPQMRLIHGEEGHDALVAHVRRAASRRAMPMYAER